MPGVTDKREILRLLLERVAADLQTMSAAQRAVVDGATHEENKPEGDKDMRSTEASYIARGQAERVREMETALAKLSSMPVLDFGATD